MAPIVSPGAQHNPAVAQHNPVSIQDTEFNDLLNQVYNQRNDADYNPTLLLDIKPSYIPEGYPEGTTLRQIVLAGARNIQQMLDEPLHIVIVTNAAAGGGEKGIRAYERAKQRIGPLMIVLWVINISFGHNFSIAQDTTLISLKSHNTLGDIYKLLIDPLCEYFVTLFADQIKGLTKMDLLRMQIMLKLKSQYNKYCLRGVWSQTFVHNMIENKIQFQDGDYGVMGEVMRGMPWSVFKTFCKISGSFIVTMNERISTAPLKVFFTLSDLGVDHYPNTPEMTTLRDHILRNRISFINGNRVPVINNNNNAVAAGNNAEALEEEKEEPEQSQHQQQDGSSTESEDVN